MSVTVSRPISWSQVPDFAQTIQVGTRTLRRMAACPSCGEDNPTAQRFCGSCGTGLSTPGPDALPEERKLVTALFCDLVGFTATSESMARNVTA